MVKVNQKQLGKSGLSISIQEENSMHTLLAGGRLGKWTSKRKDQMKRLLLRVEKIQKIKMSKR
jgi:hypothetical protein